jgi:hypothetical protein
MIVKTVVNMSLAGQSLAAIANAMNTAGHRTPSGLEVWNRRIVFDLLHTRHVQQYLERITGLDLDRQDRDVVRKTQG